ncbi:AraC family transcriptional regulator [Acinetobacter pollinis]|uniref:Helix-turn-helix transcriptional regulator n=1 Tax=Acinetobacter pollinis TaxID=2605270 RepID=A0ABU6DTQ4_9GAMM|nr:AraC family transcriptional regulator [Acinetobacter pollinis]MEB5477225.1 helix-turn-helix transcriptional regulator [Acinetobacter pollinis]
MDPLSDLMNLISAKSYVTTGISTGHKWAAHFSVFDGLKVICIKKGTFWLKTQKQTQWYKLQEGDGIILTDGQAFSMLTENACIEEAIEAKKIPHVKTAGLLDYGESTNILLAGRMSVNQIGTSFFQKELPSIIHFSTGSMTSDTLNWLLKQLLHENVSQNIGALTASNHLMHLIILEILRVWIMTDESSQSGWFKAIKDERIAKTLALIHQHPSKDWSLSELAEIANLSKSGISQKFNDLLGMSPLKYVTYWRMQIAVKSLYQQNTSIKNLAFSLGYNAESTFSTAFKRIHHVSPRTYRETLENS